MVNKRMHKYKKIILVLMGNKEIVEILPAGFSSATLHFSQEA